MNDKYQTDHHSNPSLMDRFIDGLLSDAETEEFLANTETRQEALRQLELQNKIDESLKRSFAFEPLSEQVIALSVLGNSSSNLQSASHQNSLFSRLTSVGENPLFKLALAASLLLAMGASIWMYSGPGQIDAHFQPRSLAMLYEETKDRGFRPYYNCEDQQRFADTFEKRHGQRLALAEMPEGSRMLGISYPGGVSRGTTAMLGEVDGNPVMVFVDEASNRDQAIVSVDPDSKLNVFPVEKNGLIFYEVTPLSSARMIQYFEFIERQ